MSSRVWTALTLSVLISGTAAAETLVVRQDGTGDFDNIGDALSAAAPDDRILVGPGIYEESLVVTKTISIESELGRDATVLYGRDSFRIMVIDGAINVTLLGLTFTRGYADNGSALFIWHQPTVMVEDCDFNENFAWESNAVHVRHAGTNVTFRNCGFSKNRCNLTSAALSIGTGGNMLVDGCVFADNAASLVSGAVNANGAHLDVRNSLFLRNSALGTGALVYVQSTGEITGNTFHENSGQNNGSVYISAENLFEHNIITGERRGFGLVCHEYAQHACNVFYDNATGPIQGSDLNVNEMVADPLYCDHTSDQFTLCVLSPALPSQNECGLVGAFGEGCQECGPVASEARTWSDLKVLYR